QEGCPAASDTDREGDSVADNVDRCPDLFGLIENDGCPTALDSDGDGIPDNKDRCVDAPGPAASDGCPEITSADRDGDGILDSDDLCPDESGTLDSGGCPPIVSGDRDGDGVLDASDACPEIAGDEDHDGCPFVTESDRDGDGIADDADHCPDDPGLEALDGCPLRLPPSGIAGMSYPICVRFPSLCEMIDLNTDTDGDGVSDRNDRCPEEYGVVANDGCPIISAWHYENPMSGTLYCTLFPSACGWDEGKEVQLTITLEENLYTDRDWLAVWCYVSGQEGIWYRLPPEDPSLAKRGAQIWYLGDHRSVKISTHERTFLPVHAFCQAMAAPFGDPVSLGQIVRLHSLADWNNVPYIIWSEGAADHFMLIYSIKCEDCD
ncbi:MAG: thrombospondin type 3 repeat-containing protein, partial [Anaerolineales bacterium]